MSYRLQEMFLAILSIKINNNLIILPSVYNINNKNIRFPYNSIIYKPNQILNIKTKSFTDF